MSTAKNLEVPNMKKLNVLVIFVFVPILVLTASHVAQGAANAFVRCDADPKKRIFDSQEDDQKKNVVGKGDRINWHISVEKIGTVVTFEFAGDSPFDKNSFTIKVKKRTKLVKEDVDPAAEGSYSYTITCNDGTTSYSIDPIIEVPKP